MEGKLEERVKHRHCKKQNPLTNYVVDTVFSNRKVEVIQFKIQANVGKNPRTRQSTD